MIKIRRNVPLAQYTYYKIGGKARYFCEISTQINTDTQADQHRYYQDLIDALNWAEGKGLPVFVLGGGTNILVSDEGFEGLVIKMKNEKFPACALAYAKASASKKASAGKKIQDSQYMTVSAGVKLSDVVNFSLKHGLSGLEWAAGIPGSIGGAVRGNAGAFNGEMSSVVESITVIQMKSEKLKGRTSDKISENLDGRLKNDNEKFHAYPCLPMPTHAYPCLPAGRRQAGKIKTLNNKQCKFGYRTSIIKEKGGIILEATLCLKKFKRRTSDKMSKNLDGRWKNSKLKIIEEAQGHINYRKEHHPLEYPSCGSVFKNADLRQSKINAEQRRNLEEIIAERDIKGDINRYKLILEKQKKGNLRGFVEKIGVNSRIVLPAGLLIAKVGLSGKRIGDAQISEKHSNFIINLGNAKVADVYTLIKLCEKEVYRKFGVRLEREVEMVGFADQR
jgi:UDP-N-acetylmuramate dehydrogenase